MQFFEDNQQKLIEISNEYQKLCELLNYEEVVLDKKLCLKYTKQKQLLQPIALKFEEYKTVEKNLLELKKLKELVENNEKNECEKEISFEQQKLLKFTNELEKMLITFNASKQSVILELVSGKTEQSQKLLEILLQGYSNFCQENNLEQSLSQIKNSYQIKVFGLNAFELLKNETGLHILNNEENFCQVFVYTCPNEEFSFNENDLKITTARSSGAGGQHINTTDSAIKVTHLPTNLTAVCQNERSQFQNKQKAIETLKQKVENFYLKKSNDFISKQKKELLTKAKIVIKNYDLKQEKVFKDNISFSLQEFVQGKTL